MTHRFPRSLLITASLTASALMILTSLTVGVATSADHGIASLRSAGSPDAASQDGLDLPPVLPNDEAFRADVDLMETPVDSIGFRRVAEAHDELTSQLQVAASHRLDTERQIALIEEARATELARLRAAVARRDSFERLAGELSESIGQLAAEAFMSRDPFAAVAAVSDPSGANDRQRVEVLTVAALDSLIAERSAALANADAADRARASAQASIDELDGQLLEMGAAVGAANDTAVRVAPELASVRDDLENERALARVRGTDFPLVALDAYYGAAELTAQLDPGCGVRWWALAGIGEVESRHGTYSGGNLDATGTPDRPIIGIPLTGEEGTALISDSDGGAIDGDPTIDRAVGPMQFIPDTWRRFAADGDGDGVASPHNLYDASLAAAIYLCRSGRGLDTDPALRVAYFSYNQSESYVTNVLSHARAYESDVDIEEAGA